MIILKKINGRLEECGSNIYKINHKKQFYKLGQITEDDKRECFDFAYEMVFGAGKHRNYRSGGDKKRKQGEIFINTFQGKASEYGMYRYLLKNDIKTSKPDMSVEGYGIWDSFDLEYGDVHMAVKSTKFFGNLLLLETKDWNEKGEYIPNNTNGISKYDVIVLTRLLPDGEYEMKKRMLLYSEKIERKTLEKTIYSKNWEFDVAGFITNSDLVRLIDKKYILPKGALLNGKITMDAENYYVQSGDMRSYRELIFRLKKTNKCSK